MQTKAGAITVFLWTFFSKIICHFLQEQNLTMILLVDIQMNEKFFVIKCNPVTAFSLVKVHFSISYCSSTMFHVVNCNKHHFAYYFLFEKKAFRLNFDILKLTNSLKYHGILMCFFSNSPVHL